MNRPWSKKEEKELAAITDEGTTVREAARYLRRSKASIHNKKRDLNLKSQFKGRPPDLDLRLSVLDYLSKGYNLTQIGKELGKANNVIGRLVRRMLAEKMVRRIQTGSSTRSIRYIVKET